MILLIQTITKKLEDGIRHLNSIMILLIPIAVLLKMVRLTFKFHYDSINSRWESGISPWQGHLNSIMILLILYSFDIFHFKV